MRTHLTDRWSKHQIRFQSVKDKVLQLILTRTMEAKDLHKDVREFAAKQVSTQVNHWPFYLTFKFI